MVRDNEGEAESNDAGGREEGEGEAARGVEEGSDDGAHHEPEKAACIGQLYTFTIRPLLLELKLQPSTWARRRHF